MHGLFSLGYPGETKDEILETLQYPFDVGFDSVSFFIANPMPGSELHKLCHDKGYLAKDICKMDVKSAEIVIPEDSSDFVMTREALVELVERKTTEYNEYTRKRYPEKLAIKFKQFLNRHGDQANLLLGRVT